MSSPAGVAATRRRMKSTVAAGPIPPITPTIFSPERIGFSNIAGQIKFAGISEQGRRTARMQENYVAIFSEEAFVDLINQSIHSLTRIDGVQKDALGAGNQLHRFAHSRCRKAIACANIIAVGHDMV